MAEDHGNSYAYVLGVSPDDDEDKQVLIWFMLFTVAQILDWLVSDMTIKPIFWPHAIHSRPYLYIKRGKVSVTYVCNGGCGQLSSEWRHNDNDVIMRTGAAQAIGARRHNENDITITIAGLWRYGDWWHMTTGCTALWQSDAKTEPAATVSQKRCQIFYKAVQQRVYSLTESVLKTLLQIYCWASQRKNFHNQWVFGEVTPKNTVFHSQQQTDHFPTWHKYVVFWIAVSDHQQRLRLM